MPDSRREESPTPGFRPTPERPSPPSDTPITSHPIHTPFIAVMSPRWQYPLSLKHALDTAHGTRLESHSLRFPDTIYHYHTIISFSMIRRRPRHMAGYPPPPPKGNTPDFPFIRQITNRSGRPGGVRRTSVYARPRLRQHSVQYQITTPSTTGTTGQPPPCARLAAERSAATGEVVRLD